MIRGSYMSGRPATQRGIAGEMKKAGATKYEGRQTNARVGFHMFDRQTSEHNIRTDIPQISLSAEDSPAGLQEVTILSARENVSSELDTRKYISAEEIFNKLQKRPVGEDVRRENLGELCEHDKVRVALSLAVFAAKEIGQKNGSKLAAIWRWKSIDELLNLVNSERAMRAELLKVSLLREEPKEANKVIPIHLTSLGGHVIEEVITPSPTQHYNLGKLIGRFIRRAHPELVEEALIHLKKETPSVLLSLVTSEGEIQRYLVGKGLSPTIAPIKIFIPKPILATDDDDIPATTMGMKMSMMNGMNEMQRKSFITKPLLKYLQTKYPEKYQALHAQLMSLRINHLLSLIFIPTQMEEEINKNKTNNIKRDTETPLAKSDRQNVTTAVETTEAERTVNNTVVAKTEQTLEAQMLRKAGKFNQNRTYGNIKLGKAKEWNVGLKMDDKDEICRWGKKQNGSNIETAFTIRVEKSFPPGEGSHKTLAQMYLRNLFMQVHKLGHTIRIIPSESPKHHNGITDITKLEDMEVLQEYIMNATYQAIYNHFCFDIVIVSSMNVVTLKDFSDPSSRDASKSHMRFLQNFNIWCTHLKQSEVKYTPTIIMIGSDPNDCKDAIKEEITRRARKEGKLLKEEDFQIHCRLVESPKSSPIQRKCLSMVVMAARGQSNRVTEIILNLPCLVPREEYITTFDYKFGDIRVHNSMDNNAYDQLLRNQQQYYLDRVWLRVANLPEQVNLFGKTNENDDTMAMKILGEEEYEMEGGLYYANPIAKVQYNTHRQEWCLTSHKSKLEYLVHFAEHHLIKHLSKWNPQVNWEGTRINMCPFGPRTRPKVRKGVNKSVLFPIAEEEEDNPNDGTECESPTPVEAIPHPAVEAHSTYHTMALNAIAASLKTIQATLARLEEKVDKLERRETAKTVENHCDRIVAYEQALEQSASPDATAFRNMLATASAEVDEIVKDIDPTPPPKGRIPRITPHKLDWEKELQQEEQAADNRDTARSTVTNPYAKRDKAFTQLEVEMPTPRDDSDGDEWEAAHLEPPDAIDSQSESPTAIDESSSSEWSDFPRVTVREENKVRHTPRKESQWEMEVMEDSGEEAPIETPTSVGEGSESVWSPRDTDTSSDENAEITTDKKKEVGGFTSPDEDPKHASKRNRPNGTTPPSDDTSDSEESADSSNHQNAYKYYSLRARSNAHAVKDNSQSGKHNENLKEASVQGDTTPITTLPSKRRNKRPGQKI